MALISILPNVRMMLGVTQLVTGILLSKNEWMPPRNAAHRLRERRMILGLCECESVPPDRVDPGASSETPEKNEGPGQD